MTKQATLLAVAVMAFSPAACAQQWIAPRVAEPAPTMQPSVGIDPWIRPVAYQPPGRVYAIDDSFAGQPPIGQSTFGQPTFGGATSSVPVGGVPFGPVTVGQPNYVQAPMATQGFGSPSPTQPGFVQPTYVDPSLTQPHSLQSGWVQPQAPMVVDPYAYSTAPVGAPLVSLQGALRRPYAELEGRIGDNPNSLHGNLFLPFFQQADSFWFADLRGQWDDDDAREYNAGVAWRRRYGDMIVGLYGFYDYRETRFDNEFQGATVGAEVLDLNWEARLNWYIPEGGSKATGLPAGVALVNNAIVIQNSVERAYYGFDAEIGRLLWGGGGLYDAEVRGFVGGYYFNNNAAGFNSFGGPRVRLEGRLYDLPRLGPGSRLTLGGTVQYDDIRDTQGIASINLRIPFGAGTPAGGSKLSPFERRMLSPIRRDDDIVTIAGFNNEQTVLVGNGMDGLVLSNITEVSAGQDLQNRVMQGTAAGSNIFVVTGAATTSATAALTAGQFLGGRFAVRGQTTGTQFNFGAQNTVTTTANTPAVQVANNTTTVGLSIVGGGAAGAIVDGGAGLNGATITDNLVTNPNGGGININGAFAASTLSNNVVTNTAGAGIGVGSLEAGSLVDNNQSTGSRVGFDFGTGVNGGAISANTGSSNVVGFQFADVTDGVITMNTASLNADDATDSQSGDLSVGFAFNTVTGGTITLNTATGNDSDGFLFAGNVSAGSITNTTAGGPNAGDGNNAGGFGFGGFNFFDPNAAAMPANPSVTVSGTAVITDNNTQGNGFDGFAFGDVSGGSILRNISNGDGVFGGTGSFSFFDVTGGTIDSNQALGGFGDGFVFFNSVSGSVAITDNIATSNAFDGFRFQGAQVSGVSMQGGRVSGNMATGNGDEGFDFVNSVTQGRILANVASGNGVGADDGDGGNSGLGDGFFFANIMGDAGTTSIDGNTATGNQGDGFDFDLFATGSARDNISNNNTGSGYTGNIAGAAPDLILNNNTGAGNDADDNLADQP